jgi:hypothetical protein
VNAKRVSRQIQLHSVTVSMLKAYLKETMGADAA